MIHVLLFDLGNVLVDLGDTDKLNQMLASHDNEKDAWLKWLASPSVKAFDTGQIALVDFASSLIEEVSGFKATTEQVSRFSHEFTHWPQGLFEGALALVDSVKPHIHRGILSNTNAAHWPRLMQEMNLAGHFDSYFASHHLGAAKPDVLIYQKVLAQLNVMPEQVLFIDDNQINIDAALSLGMHAHRVKGVIEAKAILEDYNLVN
ncbi:haloacid dehalogenase [Marinomonas sp. 42_23_T18]|nr:haloacid dehalogenase [Marinomonas sp. 42_23_T18]